MVRTYGSDGGIELCCDECCEDFEPLECLVFSLNEKNPFESSIVINKDVVVKASLYGTCSCFGTRKTIGVKEVHLITNALAVRRR